MRSQEAFKLRTALPSRLNRIDRLRLRKWIVPMLVPIYCLLVKGLLWEGSAGWHYTIQRAYAELLLSLKLAESQFPQDAT